MASRKVETVSIQKLVGSIDKAVHIAAKRHQIAVESDTLINRWEIVGRQLREAVDLNEAYKFAAEVTRGVSLQGIKAQPVVARVGGDILVGFVERAGMPRVLG